MVFVHSAALYWAIAILIALSIISKTMLPPPITISFGTRKTRHPRVLKPNIPFSIMAFLLGIVVRWSIQFDDKFDFYAYEVGDVGGRWALVSGISIQSLGCGDFSKELSQLPSSPRVGGVLGKACDA